MKLYPEEFECAQRYQMSHSVPSFSQGQLDEIRNVTKSYTSWNRSHPYFHNTLNVLLVIAIFSVDLWIQLALPHWMLS